MPFPSMRIVFYSKFNYKFSFIYWMFLSSFFFTYTHIYDSSHFIILL